MPIARPATKILLDSGDPIDTAFVREVLGFLDGQTTNPSLIAKDSEIVQMISSGHKMTVEEQTAEYKKLVKEISPLVGDAGVSVEVYADDASDVNALFQQARLMFSWAPNVFVKLPCTRVGLEAASKCVREGIRVNVTLCFSQQQAAAVYAATAGSRVPVYISPFAGRLDDTGKDGMSLVKNILEMYKQGDGHVKVLAASIRTLGHLMCSFWIKSDLVTVPLEILKEWANAGMPLPGIGYMYIPTGKTGMALTQIPYEYINMNQDWHSFNVNHELTAAGVKKFVEDYRKTLKN